MCHRTGISQYVGRDVAAAAILNVIICAGTAGAVVVLRSGR